MIDIPPDGIFSPDTNSYVDGSGRILDGVHDAADCSGRPCVIHAPSDHSMREFPTHFRDGWGLGEIKEPHMERICPHGVGHPDPDDLAFHLAHGRGYLSVHGCDGCCS